MYKEADIIKILKRQGYRRGRLIIKNIIKNYTLVIEARKASA